MEHAITQCFGSIAAMKSAAPCHSQYPPLRRWWIYWPNAASNGVRVQNLPSEHNIIVQFSDAMRNKEIGPAGYETITADGKLHRYDVYGDCRRSETGWYVLHADRFPNGVFGCNKRYGTDHTFT